MLNIKNDSQRLILNLIRHNKEISGAELARITEQRRSSLAYILKSLEDMGLVSISRIGESTKSGGKPPTLWKLVNSAGYFLGVEVTPKELRTVITDFSSNIIYKDIHTFNDILSEGGVSELSSFIRSRVSAVNLKLEDFIGIGISVPGMVDTLNGSVYYYSSKGIKEISLKSDLEKELNIEVAILNDANAGVLGEKWFSTSPDKLNDIIFLSINEDHAGIGAGFIFNGQLYTGFNGSAGEFIPFGINLEHIYRQYKSDFPNITIEFKDLNTISKIIAMYGTGSKVADYIFNEIFTNLSKGIAGIITLLNPKSIIIGGDFTVTEPVINQTLSSQIESVYKEHYPVGISHPRIYFSKQGIYSGAMGATAFFVDRIFNPLLGKI